MSDEEKDVGAEVVVEEAEESSQKPAEEVINVPCRVPQRDGSKGCGGMSATRLVIPNGPTFYVCQTCEQRWMPVDIGGTFPY